MDNLWLKIKVWTKITIFSAAMLYLFLFIWNNSDRPVTFWVWFYQDINTTLLKLTPSLLAAGVVGTLLTRTAFRTIRQLKELRARGRAKQLEKDLALVKSRAAMLKTKPPVVVVSPIPLEPPPASGSSPISPPPQ